MTRTPQDRYRIDMALVVEIGGRDEDDIRERMEAVAAFAQERLGKTTFARLAGQPEIVHVNLGEPSIT